MFGFSKKSNHTGMKPNLAWRDFFEGEELDRAYQIVEVEQRDESDGEEVSMGSNSDPSEDNLDEEEVYRDVYGISDVHYLLEARFDAK